jgi:hypothetical protein
VAGRERRESGAEAGRQRKVMMKNVDGFQVHKKITEEGI